MALDLIVKKLIPANCRSSDRQTFMLLIIHFGLMRTRLLNLVDAHVLHQMKCVDVVVMIVVVAT